MTISVARAAPTPRQGAAPAPQALWAAQSLFQQHMLGQADVGALLAGSAERRALGLDIYANAYRRRLVEALADAYANTLAWLGAECFDAMALAYIEKNPPAMRNLRWYGADFAGFVASYPEFGLAAKRLQAPPGSDPATKLPGGPPGRAAPAELASLEWALRGAFDGPDRDVLTPAGLAGITAHAWASVRLEPVPTARLLRLELNTVAVWQALNDEQAPPPSAPAEGAVLWLVWRKELQPHFRSLETAEAALLHAIFGGAGFADACAAAQAQHDTLDAEQIGACMRQWLDDGLIGALQADATAGD